MEQCILRVALDSPLDFLFDYAWPRDAGVPVPLPGQLALVPFGRREVVGVIMAIATETQIAPEKLKSALAIRSDLLPLSPQWLALCGFAADYYQRPLGEVMLPGLPKNVRLAKPTALNRALKKAGKVQSAHDATPATARSLTMPSATLRQRLRQPKVLCRPCSTA